MNLKDKTFILNWTNIFTTAPPTPTLLAAAHCAPSLTTKCSLFVVAKLHFVLLLLLLKRFDNDAINIKL